ncbi:uncharacterized protein LOC129185220 isoform X2 [Dunckerocampus dactyliophorus]|uniref:uncharacterized protein LOC129185220 isoform X2 n=1 Tax=Dunckerocampus dactyliophorus TaxID=161453 RepID=UPI00240542AE|nr:uncharacterized protein LOC129185220 isoform X2 [Dunckerocampus dactyliophorus]
MTERRTRRRRKSPEQDAVDHVLQGRDKPFLEGTFINTFKGRGVFTQEYIEPKSFVVEYRGVLSLSKGHDDKNNNYLFDFKLNGQHYCIDALKEDGTLGRLVNDDHINPNCKMKKILVKGRPHLCLFALKEIFPGEEISYNYGDSPWPWRSKAHCKEPHTTQSEKKLSTSAQEQKELVGSTSRPTTEVTATPGTLEDDDCLHKVTCSVVNSLDNCDKCSGRPLSSLKWIGLTCQLCSKSWHKSCFLKRNSSLDVEPDDHDSINSSDGCRSDEDYVPSPSVSSDASDPKDLSCTSTGVPASTTDSDDLSVCKTHPSPLHRTARAANLVSSKQIRKRVPQPIDRMREEDRDATTSTEFGIEEDIVPDSESSDDDPTTSNTQSLTTTSTDSQAPKGSSCTKKNYCYVCKTPQSKIARHLKQHEKDEPDIAEAFLHPNNSKERKKLLEKLRNKGNYEHNQEVPTNNEGFLKVKRRSKQSKDSVNTKTFVHCAYCRGMFIRKELWRHSRRCPFKTVSESEATAKATCLDRADIAESTCAQAISPGVWKVLKNMRQDEVASVVRNDFLILQLSQFLYNKHGTDPTKFEYMRQKAREMGRLLLTLRKTNSIFSFEDATKPKNFYKVIEAVRTVAGYDEEKTCYRTPSLALKLGHSLKKIGDIILCRAIAAEDEQMIKAAERFIHLCTKEWTGLVSPSALATLTKSKFHKPSTFPFTEDVQLLHQYLEKKSAEAVESLKEQESPQTYAELARVTLAQIIIFNRRRAGEVSKMTLESFERRDQTELHEDIAALLSHVEQKLAKHYSRVEIIGKRGRKVAVLLSPEVLKAAELIADKRDTCNVHKDNPFLFGRPRCPSTSYFRGQDCIRTFARMCGAKNPEYLRSTHLHKHVGEGELDDESDGDDDGNDGGGGHDKDSGHKGGGDEDCHHDGGVNDSGGDDNGSGHALGPRGKRKRMKSTEDKTKDSKGKRMKSTEDKTKASKGQNNLLAIQDIQQLTGHQGDRPPQPQGGSSTWGKEEPQPPLIKEEEMELHIKEEEEKPQPPLIKEEEMEPEHPHIKEEEEEKPQPPLIKEEEIEPEHPHMKEKEEEPQPSYVKEEGFWITQEGEHLPGPEEADLARLPLTGVPAVTKDHEDKPPELSQLHHSPSEEMSEAEPSCSSSLQHMTTEADGDHCGGSQADNLLAPLSDSDDTTSHSPKGEDSDYNQESLSSDTDCEADMMTDTGNKHSESSKKTTGKRLNCSVCHKRLSWKSDLAQHMRTHTGEKPFSCSDCGKYFTFKTSMQRHMRTHKGEKPYSCSDCGKGFTQKTSMQSHMRIHTGEKPFSCSDCGKLFTQKTSMQRHMRTHKVEKPFSCSHCGKGFAQKIDMQVHMRTHTGEKPFSCSDCGKLFTQKTSVQLHMRTHTGEKPFSCSDCGKGFARKSDMQRHMRTHTGEKPFSCSDCGKHFTFKAQVQSHVRTHRRKTF